MHNKKWLLSLLWWSLLAYGCISAAGEVEKFAFALQGIGALEAEEEGPEEITEMPPADFGPLGEFKDYNWNAFSKEEKEEFKNLPTKEEKKAFVVKFGIKKGKSGKPGKITSIVAKEITKTPKIEDAFNFYTFFNTIKDDLKNALAGSPSEIKINEEIEKLVDRRKADLSDKNDRVNAFKNALKNLPYGNKPKVKDILGNNAPTKITEQIEKYVEWAQPLHDSINNFFDKVGSKAEYQDAWAKLDAAQKNQVMLTKDAFPKTQFQAELSEAFFDAVDNDTFESFIKDKLKGKSSGGTGGKGGEKPIIKIDVLEVQQNASGNLKNKFKDIFEAVEELAKQNRNVVADKAASKKIGKELELLLNEFEEEIFSDKEQKTLNDVVAWLNGLGAGLKITISATGKEEVIVKGCQKEEQWLATKNGDSTNEEVFREKTMGQAKQFNNSTKNFGKSTDYKSIPLKNAKNSLTSLQRSVSSSGRLSLKSSEDQAKLPKIFGDYAKVVKNTEEYEKLSEEAQAEFNNDLGLMVVLYPAMLNDVIAYYKDTLQFDATKIYDLLLKFYALNIGYLVPLLEQENPSFTGQNKTDLDFTVGYYEALLDYRTKAENESNDKNAQKFVKNVNDLNDYLKALLCRKQKSLEEAGFDYKISARMLDDEKQRVWHKENADIFINAPWDRLITYVEGKDIPAPSGLKSKYVLVDETTGGPKQKPEQEWPVIDKDNPFYRHFNVDLREINEEIKKYDADAKKNKLQIFESVQGLRIKFIADSVKKFYDYLKKAEGKGIDKSGDACEACLIEDLYGLYDEKFRIYYKREDNKWVADKDRQKRESKQVDDNLEEARQFFEQFKESKDQGLKDRSVETIKEIEFIQQYKKDVLNSEYLTYPLQNYSK